MKIRIANDEAHYATLILTPETDDDKNTIKNLMLEKRLVRCAFSFEYDNPEVKLCLFEASRMD